MIFNFVASLQLQYVRSPTARALINTGLGLFISFYSYGYTVAIWCVYSFTAYACMLLLPRRLVDVFTILLCTIGMTACNLFVQLIDTEGFSVRTLVMITFVKQTQIAVNYRDGLGDKILSPHAKQQQLAQVPTLLEYCSYMFNLQSSVIGPPFEYKDWNEFIYLKGKYSKPRMYAHYRFAF